MKKTLVSALTTALVVGAASTTFAAANPFEDVPADHWAYDAVAQLAADGVIEGYGDGTYRGDQEITRYEMAQMVARAMAKGGGDKALIDKLAAEFADELNNLGVRVAALEKKVDNVKWQGKLRYRYIHSNIESSSTDRENINQVLLRFEPQMKINEHWTGRARLDYAVSMDNAANTDKVTVDRIWAQGKYNNLLINLGKLTYKTQADYGLLMDRYISGGNVVFGKDIMVGLSIGRVNDFDNKLDPNYSTKANSFGTRIGTAATGDGTDSASTYGSIEIYNDRSKRFTWGIGYHRFGNRDLEKWHGAANNRTWAPLDSDNISILNLGLGYKFTKDLELTGAWSHAFGADLTGDAKAQIAREKGWGDINGSQKNSYAVQLNYAGAKGSKPGSWGMYVAWRQIGQISSTGWNTYALNGPQYAGSRGFEVGASWAPMKNVVGKLSWFTGKNLEFLDGDGQDKKVNTIFTEWNFMF